MASAAGDSLTRETPYKGDINLTSALALTPNTPACIGSGTSLKPEAKPTVLRPIQQETPMARLDAFFFTPPLTAKPHEPSDVSAQDTKQQACSDRECRKRKLNFQQAVSELGDDSNDSDAENVRPKNIAREQSPAHLVQQKPALTERQQVALLLKDTNASPSVASSPASVSSYTPSRLVTRTTPAQAVGVAILKDKKVNLKNRLGETPLQRAAIKGDVALVKKLLAQGAEVNTHDNAGWTPLHEAANHGHLDVTEVLLQAGALPNARGMGGEAPLHDASINEHVDIARVLVKYGADIHQKNDKGESPLDLCELPELQEIFLGHTKNSRREKKRNKKRVKVSDDQEHGLSIATEDQDKAAPDLAPPVDNSQSTALATVQLDTAHIAESSPPATPTREALAMPLEEQAPVAPPAPLAATPERAGTSSASQQATPLQAAAVYAAPRPATAPPTPVVEPVPNDDELNNNNNNAAATVNTPPATSQSEAVTWETASPSPSPVAATTDAPECEHTVPAEMASPSPEHAVPEPAVPAQMAPTSTTPIAELQLPAIVKPAAGEGPTFTVPVPVAVHTFAKPSVATRGAVHKPKQRVLCVRRDPEARARLLAQADVIDARREERARENTRHKRARTNATAEMDGTPASMAGCKRELFEARRQLGTRHEAEEHRFKEWAVSETMRMAEAVPEHVLNTRPDLLVGAVAAVNVNGPKRGVSGVKLLHRRQNSGQADFGEGPPRTLNAVVRSLVQAANQLSDRQQYEWQALQQVQELEWEEQAKVAHARVPFPFLPVLDRRISVTDLLQTTLGLA